MHAFIDSARKVTTTQELDTIGETVESYTRAVEQLTTSMQACSRSGKKMVGRRATDEKKKKTEQEAEAAKKNQSEIDAQAGKVQQMLQYKTSSAVFFVDYTAIGHQQVPAHFSKTAMRAGGAKVFSAPVKCSASFEGLKAFIAEDLYNQWAEAIKEPLVKIQVSDAVTHQLSESDQSSSVLPAMKEFIAPEDAFIKDLKTKVLNDSLVPMLFGYSDQYVRFDYEPNYLGSIRTVSHGTLKMLLLNPAVCATFLKEDQEALALAGGQQEIGPATVTKFMQNLTAQCAQNMIQKCSIHFCTVSAGEVVYVPPGWAVGIASINSTIASGVKANVLPKNYDKSALVWIKQCSTEKSTLQCLDIILAAGDQ